MYATIKLYHPSSHEIIINGGHITLDGDEITEDQRFELINVANVFERAIRNTLNICK